jgi:hypothetical protein
MLHKNALQAARISKLEKQLAIITKRKARKRKRIQHGGTIEYSKAASRVAIEAAVAAKRSKKPRGSSSQERAQPGVRRCRNCSRTRHNARTCKKNTKISSKLDASTTYAGFLFNSD